MNTSHGSNQSIFMPSVVVLKWICHILIQSFANGNGNDIEWQMNKWQMYKIFTEMAMINKYEWICHNLKVWVNMLSITNEYAICTVRTVMPNCTVRTVMPKKMKYIYKMANGNDNKMANEQDSK